MIAALPKLKASAPSVALVLHLFKEVAANRDPFASDISLQTMTEAIAIVRWFTHEAERIYDMPTESSEQRTRRRLRDWLNRRPGKCAKARDLQRSNGKKYRTKEDAWDALDGLVQTHLARWEAPTGKDTESTCILIVPDDPVRRPTGPIGPLVTPSQQTTRTEPPPTLSTSSDLSGLSAVGHGQEAKQIATAQVFPSKKKRN